MSAQDARDLAAAIRRGEALVEDLIRELERRAYMVASAETGRLLGDVLQAAGSLRIAVDDSHRGELGPPADLLAFDSAVRRLDDAITGHGARL